MKSENELRALVRDSISRRRNVFVVEIARKIFTSHSYSNFSVEGSRSGESGIEWISISSLSQLRKATGGRFQNLKEKWVKAGLPLRQHRGDKSEEWTLLEEGWLALSLWINKQGYEVRLSDRPKDVIFEIRKVNDR